MLLVLLGAVILIVFIVIVEHCQSPLGARFGATTRDGGAVSAGASRGRMVRQMLTESMLLSLIGGAAGIATAVGTLGFILRFVPSNVPRLNEVRIDWVVLAFALLISILTGLVFGLAPALHSAKALSPRPFVKAVEGPATARKTGRLRDVLIVSELAFAVILMVGAGFAAAYAAGSVAGKSGLQSNSGCHGKHMASEFPTIRRRIRISVFLAEPPLIVSCCGA